MRFPLDIDNVFYIKVCLTLISRLCFLSYLASNERLILELNLIDEDFSQLIVA